MVRRSRRPCPVSVVVWRWVFTMDAGHTVRSHATFITEQLLAHYVMIVKENTPGLLARLDALDWAAVPVAVGPRRCTGPAGAGCWSVSPAASTATAVSAVVGTDTPADGGAPQTTAGMQD